MCGVSEKFMFACSNLGLFVSHFMEHFQAHSTQVSCWIGYQLIFMLELRISNDKKQPSKVVWKMCSERFLKFHKKHLCWSLFLIKHQAGRRLYYSFMV